MNEAVDTTERASVSKFLSQFEKPDNIAIMPGDSLAARSPGLEQQKRAEEKAERGGQAVIETPERASVSKFLAQFDKPNNVALMPDKSLSATKEKNSRPLTGTENVNDSCKMLINSSVPSLPFAKEKASRPLRICCYGSSSSKTPELYLRPAAEVGYLLGVRGHTCVNGAGTFGCMGALNEGCAAGNGHIVGVIHKMWLVDGADLEKEWGVKNLRDGGAHSVFQSKASETMEAQTAGSEIPQSHGGPHPSLNGSKDGGPIREMLVAGGKDLQERKRLLVNGADALIVMPGGPGTWDELWEMACARNIGLSKLPIVCVNVNGFYDPFRQMLLRASKDQLLKLNPAEIVHFVQTPEEAVKWAEDVQSHAAPAVSLKKREKSLRSRNQSVLGSPVVEKGRSLLRSFSSVGDWTMYKDGSVSDWTNLTLALGTGLVLGFILSGRLK